MSPETEYENVRASEASAVHRRRAERVAGLFHPCFCRERFERSENPSGKKMV